MLVASQRDTLIILTHYEDTMKMAHDSHIFRAKENLKLCHGGPSHKDKHQATTDGLSRYGRAVNGKTHGDYK